jgi:acyl-CoA hydrolase
LKASINMAGRTSMEIGVRVEAENFITGEVRHTSSAYLTFVALDENSRPKAVPPLVFENDEERRRNQEALMRKKMRLDQKTKEDTCQKDGICEL